MNKSELIDAVKRWQVAAELCRSDYWQPILESPFYYQEFTETTNTFLALLEGLDDEEDCFPWWRLLDYAGKDPTEPGVGFGGT